MTRKRFLYAFEEATYAQTNGLQDLKLDDVETISFTYTLPGNSDPVCLSLRLIATNVDEYPAGNSYILFTEDHLLDVRILGHLEKIQQMIDRTEILPALVTISSELFNVITAGRSDNPIDLVDSPYHSSPKPIRPTESSNQLISRDNGDDEGDEMDWDMADIDSDNGFGFDDAQELAPAMTSQQNSIPSSVNLNKIRNDLLAARTAGFKVGTYGNPTTSGVVCVSIRMKKLGISEEAMKAWGVSGKQYLVLLIRFSKGYRDLYQYKDAKPSDDRVEMHVALCDRYKPSPASISEAFNQANSDHDQSSHTPIRASSGVLEQLFIGKPLNELLRDRFASIVKFRSFGIGWAGAEKLFNETQGAMAKDLGQAISEQRATKDRPQTRSLPEVVMSDALEKIGVADASLPLVAMQFVLRHFVRCTEFCLACHCPTEDTFEALKPYVCSKPLCLYQFLSYGFGPPVEHEILSQPHVVDLLVSLCFSQAAAHKLQDVPLGLNLKVPLLPDYTDTSLIPVARYPAVSKSISSLTPKIEPAFYSKWNREENYLTIDGDDWKTAAAMKEGDWIAIVAADENVRHYRIKYMLLPHVYIFDGIVCKSHQEDYIRPLPTDEVQVECYLYNQDFDSLPSRYQHQAILAMLRCIPSIPELRCRLLDQRGKYREPALRYLRDIPQAARDLLRWIIASNRSCIVQVDTVGDDATDVDNLLASEPRVAGMTDWIQFRFAQGAPDKEQRFVDAIRKHSTNAQYQTIFAWHGSPVWNWHSIIRHGLNYDVVLHGRASGDGVYMSSLLHTSIGYTQGGSSAAASSLNWTNSELSVSTVVSLQEVVNAVPSFVSSNPHFVVAQKDWIQTRYLFVKSTVSHSKKGVSAPPVDQDPNYIARGTDNKAVVIPMTAIPKDRHSTSTHPSSTTSPGKVNSKGKKDRVRIDHDSDDDSTDEEDLLWFGIEDQSQVTVPQTAEPNHVANRFFTASRAAGSRKRTRDQPKYILDKTKTDFIPGALEIANIKFLPPPADPSPAATRALMKAFQALLETQETTPLHELGFYVDPDRTENMYQWIIELHSFDRDLPLAEDMAKAGLTSIVLELRFTNQFPFSPPFVRVIKPRFLPFLRGGGGHVTEGGAICMELLTSSGWTVVSSIESVILQVRLAMTERERPARLLSTAGRWGTGKTGYDTSCYGIADAVQAFKRACSRHGWQLPDGLEGMSSDE